jgi:AsmA protein
MRKSVKIGLATALGLLILAGAAIHLFVNADTFRPVIESRLSTALSRKVSLGNLSFSLLTGSLVANDLTIAETSGFGQTPFLNARQLRIGVEVKPLIFHRQLIVRSFEVDGPQIHLTRAEDGTWNFSTLGHGVHSQSAPQSPALSDLSVGIITIKDGHVQIETLPLQGNPQVYDNVDVKLKEFSLAKSFPFAISATLPGNGNVNIIGTVGPINTQDAASTAFDAQVRIEHLDPVAAGYVDPDAGISMIASLDAHIVSNGADVTSNGKVHAEHLILLKGGKAAPYPVDVSYQITHSLAENSGEIADLAVQTGSVAIHVMGTYQLASNVPVFDLKLLAQAVPIDGLQALMPAVGVTLPNGAVLKGGTLSANFSLKGSAKDNVIVGSYEIRSTRLVGFDLGSKIHGIAALSGIKTGDITAIEISRANVRMSKSGSETTNIYSVLPALGESTGSGTVSPTGALNFHLICKVANAKGLNGIGVNLLTKLNNTSAASKPSAAVGIPINITGTARNPIITADISGLAKGNAAALGKKGAALFNKTGIPGLFGKKK